VSALGIRFRLGLASALCLALGAILIVAPAWFVYRNSLLDTARGSLEVEAARVAESADEGLRFEGEGGQGRILYAAILDGVGEPLSSRGREIQGARSSTAFREAIAGRRASYVDPTALAYVAAAAPIAPEEDHGYDRPPRAVLVVASTGEILGAARSLGWLLAALIPLASILAGVGGWALAGRALAPVDAMTRWAASVGEQDMGGRIAVPATDDEIARLAVTLNAMIGRIEEAFARNVRFVADASHEIRNPLTNLSTEIQAMLRRDRESAEYRATLASTLDEVRRLSRLADGLLFLARSDAGKAVGAPVRVDLAAMLAEVEAAYREKAKETGIALAAAAAGTPGIDGDREAIRRLIENLVENAVRYTPSGGRVTLRARAADGRAILSVEDTGIGISEADRPHLFERFWRGAAARERAPEGSGLGLAICREIVAAHGGTIAIRPGEGCGTRVEISFAS
jgi:heavy metal sensor kinase